MTSPLNPSALTVDDLHIGDTITTVKYNTIGTTQVLDENIAFCSFYSLTVTSITETTVFGERTVGSARDEIDLIKFGLKPDADDNWSLDYCVVSSEVAHKMSKEWRANFTPDIHRGAMELDRQLLTDTSGGSRPLLKAHV